MPRLFVAVTPPADVLDLVDALPRPEERGVRWTRRDQWHVTLRFLGEASVDDAIESLSSVSASAVDVELGPAVSRLGRNVICVPAHGLGALAEAVGSATAGIGEPPDPRPFAGHLTLARLKQRGSCGLAGQPFSARFRADRFELVRSELRSDGARYTVERAWTLS